MIFKGLCFLFLVFFLVYVFLFILRKPTYEGPITDHFDGKKFYYPNERQPSFLDFIKWMATRNPSPWPSHYQVTQTKPLATSENITVTFVNHATILLQWQGLNILTDPIWSERASPFPQFGPKRVHAPGIAMQDLPRIDVVLISHNHYDHLDIPTLKMLYLKDNPLFITGLGNKRLLQSNGITNVKELDWWQSIIYKGLAITFTPSRHFSARWPWDRNETLFGSFVVSSEDEHIFFSGDTAYGPHLNQIYQRFGEIKLAFLPIGAFEPRWFMKYNHMSPLDALMAQDTLKAETAIGIHFGTFQLSDEPIDAPVNLILENKKNKNFILLNPGESIKIN